MTSRCAPYKSAAPPHTNGATDSNHADAPQPTDVHRVLLLIAVQVCMLRPPDDGGVPTSLTVGPNIAQILARARTAPNPPLIIHVRNMGDAGEADEPGAPGWQLVHTPLPHEPVIDKLKNNAFAGTQLGKLIPPHAEIIVAGMQSDFCVRATCSAALGRGNEVLLIRGAHATYDRLEGWGARGGTTTPAAMVEEEIEGELEEAGVMLFEMKDVPGIFADDR